MLYQVPIGTKPSSSCNLPPDRLTCFPVLIPSQTGVSLYEQFLCGTPWPDVLKAITLSLAVALLACHVVPWTAGSHQKQTTFPFLLA